MDIDEPERAERSDGLSNAEIADRLASLAQLLYTKGKSVQGN